jgi:hypothetical protein
LRTYVIVAGVVFSLLTLAHIWRLAVEPHLATEPWFMLATVVAAALAVAAWWVARPARPGGR